MIVQALEHFDFRIVLFVALCELLGTLNAALQQLHIRHNQLQIDGLNVALRVNAALNMNDVRVVKAANNMHDGIHFSDMRQELVAQAFALGCTAHQTGNVNKFYNSRNGLGRLIHFAQLIQTFIRHAYHADIRVDGAERIIRRLRAGIRDGIEQGALSHVRQSDNTNFHVLRSFNLSCGMIWSPRLFLHTFIVYTCLHLLTSILV